MRFAAGSKPLCAAFSPDGSALITGSSDGFLEVWDPQTCRLRGDLRYQADDELMLHDAPVLAVAPSTDSTALASGDKEGCLKVWRLATGACVRKFPKAQPAALCALAWSRDGATLLSASSDGSVRSHGLKSGRVLQQFRGHAAFVGCVAYLRSSGEQDSPVSGSADGTVKVWDPRSAEATSTLSLPRAVAKLRRTQHHDADGRAVVAVLQVPGSESRFVVVDKSPTAALCDLKSGAAVAVFSSHDEPTKVSTAKRTPGCDFVAAALSSPKGDFLYCLGDDKVLYCFHVPSAKLDRVFPIDDARDVVGLAVHPHRNLVASFGDSDTLKLWRS